ncbi:MAG: F-type H+-transporting ATPase subunit b [Planctomycetota bacterium]|jgi:F-type H+-transporting ATPase subunit b
MLIDWFTVVAQVINFLILVWLLKRFLYQPILNAIDAREKHIALALADADVKKTEALKERDDYHSRNVEFDSQYDAGMKKMKAEVKAERLHLLDTARQESTDLRSKRQEALQNEHHNLREALTHLAREEVFAITRQTLTALAGITLEARMIDVFIDRLRELDSEQVTELRSAFNVSTRPVLVRTTFVMSPEQRAAIQAAVKETLNEDKQFQFETTPNQVSGIEISANGKKVAWSITDYLASLGNSVDCLLKPESASINKMKSEQGTDGNGA